MFYCFCLLEEFVQDWSYFFLKCLKEFSGGAKCTCGVCVCAHVYVCVFYPLFLVVFSEKIGLFEGTASQLEAEFPGSLLS